MMEQRLQLGRVAGIGVAVHWSVLVIAVLLAWGLATVTLPDVAPGYAEAWYWLAGLAGVVAFFVALLSHELAHSVVARGYGIEVEDITLWLFGGMSRLRGEAQTPSQELRIAAAGPGVSFAIAAMLGVVAAVVSAVDGSPLLIATIGWLAVINGLLGLFNLAPAAPLDGGRVLHAVVWRHTGDRSRATAIATRAGQLFAYFLIGIGVLLVLLGDLSAIWFVFLGWFVLAAARAEATHDLLRGALAHVRARDVMTPRPVVVPEDVPLDHLIDEWFLRERCSAFPTVDETGRVRGLITLQQVRHVPTVDRARLRAADVADALDAIVTCAPDDELPSLLERLSMATGGGGRALVFEHGALVGIITPTDVQRALDVAALRHTRRDPPFAREAQDVG